jgi:large subunit ribosomal protein L21e
MTTFGKGMRAGTRRKLAREKRKKFKAEPFLQDFKPGQRVVIRQDPSSHGGMPHVRYKGRVGVVRARRGSAYVLGLRVGKKEREIIARPEHLKPARQ